VSIERDKVVDTVREAWHDTLKARLISFYNNEIIENSETADAQLRNSLAELKKAYAESIAIIDESFPQ
jgi:hypothetical protein